VRNAAPEDFEHIIELSRLVYPGSRPWRPDQLASHLRVFPEGQLVAVERSTGSVLGLASSLIVLKDDYEHSDTWRDYTDSGMFTNHDPQGHTLYGAEVMIQPEAQRRGIGSKLYEARRDLVRRLGLKRILATSRLRGYHRYAKRMTAEEYVIRVVRGSLRDPTLSFQIKHGFEVIDVVGGYLVGDAESLGFGAVIEWLNPEVARAEDRTHRDDRFRRPT